MAEFKLVVSDPKSGKSVQREAKEEAAQALIGMKIGDKLKGDTLDLSGYEFELTGGSDYCGFPMRKDVQGVGRKRILAVEGVGIKKKARGIKQRKTVCGNTVHEKITQLNLKVITAGKENLFEAKKEEKADAKEQPKEKPKAEEKPKDEKPAKESKPEAKEEKPKAKAEEKKAAPEAEKKE